MCWKPCSSCWSLHLLQEEFLSAPIHSPPSLVRRIGPSWCPILEQSGGSLCPVHLFDRPRAFKGYLSEPEVRPRGSDPRAKRRVARGWLVHLFDRASAFEGYLEQASSWSPLTLSGRHDPLGGLGLESPFDWTFGFTFSLGRNNEQGYHLLWRDLPIFLENQFTVRPTPSSVLCCLWLCPKTVADFVQLCRPLYSNTTYVCYLLIFHHPIHNKLI
jgi:hypothetical protein